jgi:long-chain acyl-CoA synthetase
MSAPGGDAERPWLALYDPGVPHTLEPYPDVPLHDYVRRSAETYGDRAALVFYGGSTSFRELADRVDRLATALQRLGVRKGDRVALMLPNCPQFAVAFYAALRAGATVAGINPLYTPRELRHVLVDSGAETLVVLTPMLRVFDAVAAETPVRRVIVTGIDDYMPPLVAAGYAAKARAEGTYVEAPDRDGLYRLTTLVEGAEPAPAPVETNTREDVAVLQYTGGTTGTSKGAMLTHRNVVSNCLQAHAWSARLADGAETGVAVLPFFHIYGLTVVLNLSVVAAGTTLVVLPRFDADEVLDAVAKHRATFLPVVPSMLVALNAALAARPRDLSSLKLANSGAAALSPEVAREFAALAGLGVTEGYGLSEASPTTHSNPQGRPPRAGSMGVPLPDVECKIADGGGRRVPAGDVGEICVRGPNVMKGYWRKPEETALALREDGDGGGPWLHTGDLARMDDDGYFYIVDRKKDMIIVGGFNVYPREVEEVLFEHAAVQEAAVYGAPDAYFGEVVRAAVVLRPGASATPDEVIAHCRARLVHYKTPKSVEIRAELPKSTVGKVLRRVLRDEARAG